MTFHLLLFSVLSMSLWVSGSCMTYFFKVINSHAVARTLEWGLLSPLLRGTGWWQSTGMWLNKLESLKTRTIILLSWFSVSHRTTRPSLWALLSSGPLMHHLQDPSQIKESIILWCSITWHFAFSFREGGVRKGIARKEWIILKILLECHCTLVLGENCTLML